MKKYFRVVCILILIFSVCSCASWRVASPPEWKYEKEAINLRLRADPLLNLYEGSPHPLSVCVYQFGDPNAFNQLAGYDDGLYKLLECDRFDAGVTSSKRLIVHPGENLTYAFDRADGAKYVAIVAGYYMLQKEGMVRLFEIPVVVGRVGLLRLTKVSRPGALNVDLVLGTQQIRKIEEK